MLVRILGAPDVGRNHTGPQGCGKSRERRYAVPGLRRSASSKFDVRDALVPTEQIVEAHGHPERLAADKVVFGAHVLEDNINNHIST
jgi:hypothetical protein